MDEILGVIIDSEGMSFNDLKPIYKEFLLKLSVTLTKDELYQRSKLIMRRQKKKMLKRTLNQQSKSSPHILVGNKFKRFKHIFRRNFKVKGSKLKDSIVETTVREPAKLPESSISTSSYDTRQFTPKEEQSKKLNYRKKISDTNRRDRVSTSEESDFSSLRIKSKNSKLLLNTSQHNRNSSSGYVSCSECSYDSDTCTCVSADKCYCSLGHKNLKKNCDCRTENTLVFCDCDTDSCAESNKCYCQNPSTNSLILKQLKKRGLVPIHNKHQKLCQKISNSRSTQSLEYLHGPIEPQYEKLGSKTGETNNRKKKFSKKNFDYELLGKHSVHESHGYSSVSSRQQVPKQTSLRSYSSAKHRGKGELLFEILD